MSVRPPSPRRGTADNGQDNPAYYRASEVAAELLRTALLAKLAVDIEDPVLARRAARYATASARLLSGLDFPPHSDDDDDHAGGLPEVGDLLEQLHPFDAQPEEASA